jgi:hypothetical protein
MNKNIKKTDWNERKEFSEETKEKFISKNDTATKILELKKTSSEYIKILNANENLDNIFNEQFYLLKLRELNAEELFILSDSKNKDVMISLTERGDLNKKIIKNIIKRAELKDIAIVYKVVQNLIIKQSKLLSLEDKRILNNKMLLNEKLYQKEIKILNKEEVTEMSNI